ncbi:uncharacterized protein LY89DRAFT_743991 [Mollisia scopiformis]|uniref:Uncharacterized protein n=1 Tax=Mollisia scopiformis TaxID=149040 RepID=A0A132B1K2_MOLSC|nr:uncharacterized protein LY89DRAFT_743991 [Mollisia scopiformis]KUJ06265.1 hypothetical protein LY89DRAFT_743991 [Mollisia scopiformis]
MPPTLDADFHGDTIVVKGEYAWDRTRESMESEVDLDVGHLLAQLSGGQHLSSPDLEEELSTENLPTDSSSRIDHSANRAPRQRHKLNTATMEERLIQMQEVRPLPWRDGVEPGAENETGGESRRKQIRFGCLLATRGEIQEVPCNSCANGRGKFRHCIALEGFFKGACASCQLSGRPNRCSIKKNDDTIESPTANTPGNAPSRNPSQYQPSSDPQPKRRKTDTVPDWESARPQWEQELGESHARQQMSEIGQRSWATVNSPTSMPMGGSGLSGPGSRNPSQSLEHRNSMGWAAVNQPPAGPGPATFANVGESNGGGSYRSTVEQGRREETSMIEDGSVALIDTLPKSKQRQVYMLVSGLQSGISHLQRELEALKKALGIDDD